jgi:hypothetical protein
MQPITVTVGAVASSDVSIAAAQNVVAATTLTLTAGAASIAYPAQLNLVTSADYTGINFTVTGTGATGQTQTEVIAGPNTGSASSVLFYKSVTSIVSDGGVGGGAVSAGTTGVTSTRWVYFDSWSTGTTALQCNVTGTVNYTVQSTLDDPNSPTNPVSAVNCVWVDSNDTAVVNSIATVQSNFVFTPVYGRVLMNSGTGTVATTFAQTGVTNL